MTERAGSPAVPEDAQPEFTPVEYRAGVWVKRDDLYVVAGVNGGKVRALWQMAQGATGLVTAAARYSPQLMRVAYIAHRLGIPARIHVSHGSVTPEMAAAKEAGAELVQHRAGYLSVCHARAHEDALATGWTEVRFGAASAEAIDGTAWQVRNLPKGKLKRIVLTVGSGVSLAGVLVGIALHRTDLAQVPVLGVVVGPTLKRPAMLIDQYVPFGWRAKTELVSAGVEYSQAIEAGLGGIRLDPYYEAKALPFLRSGDLFWIVGVR